MEETKRVIKFQNYDLKKSVGMFWLVIGLLNILAYTLNIYSNSNIRFGLFTSDVDMVSIAGSNLMPIVIFFIVYGILMYHEDFTLALSFGITRKNFYTSLIVNNMIVALIFGTIQGALQVLDIYIVKYLGYKAMTDFGIFNTSTDNILFIVLSLVIFFLTIASITNLLGVLQFRFGYKLWIGLGIILIIGLGQIFGQLVTWFWGVLSYLFMGGSLVRILTQLGIAIICYSLGYILMKRTSTKK